MQRTVERIDQTKSDRRKKMELIRTRMLGMAIGIVAFAMSAAAQTGTVPLDAGTPPAGLTNSTITVLNGNVGIGTPNPSAHLDINPDNSPGTAKFMNFDYDSTGNNNYGSFRQEFNTLTLEGGSFGGNIQLTPYFGSSYNANAGLTVNNSGNVGIGTANPGVQLDIAYGNITPSTLQYTNLRVAPASTSGAFNGNGAGIALSSSTNIGILPVAGISSALWNGGTGTTDYSGGFLISTKNTGDSAPVSRVAVDPSGNVGIGTTNPGAKFEVSGNIKLTANSGGSITFQDGSVQTVAYTGVTCGGDYAESVDVGGDRMKYEPGDVLVIDPNIPGRFLKSADPYSTSVSGIYSTKPGTVGRRQTTAKGPDEIPMAVVGIVPTKASVENGAIHLGDLLVSSSIVGYAMKGTDRSRMLGAVIGKAMGNLDAGTGMIEVLVTLQ